MALSDYLAALHRHWRIAAGFLLACLMAAGLAAAVLPRSYEATAQVFVSSTTTGSGSFQFVDARVASYPDVARSPEVLEPVIAELGLDLSLTELRDAISAANPADTSQVDVTAVSADPEQAADIANAAARQFATVVVALEKPDGEPSPVALTVTTPATSPSSPASPPVLLLLALALVIGTTVGTALALIRSSFDTTLHDEDDVRRAWGPGGDRLGVHQAPRGRLRRSRLVGRPATVLARRLQLMAESAPVRVLLLSPGPDRCPSLRFAEQVAEELRAGAVPSAVSGPTGGPTAEVPAEVVRARGLADGPAGPDAPAERRAQVRLAIGDPVVPVRELRLLAEHHDGVVVVIEEGTVDRRELHELRELLTAVGVEPIAVMLLPAARRHRDEAPLPAAQARSAAPAARRIGDRSAPAVAPARSA